MLSKKQFLACVFCGLAVLAIGFLVLPKATDKISQDLKLKTDKDNIIGFKEIAGGKVKYAYKTLKMVDDNPTALVQQQAQSQGLVAGKEDINKRTKYSRTFKTSENGTYMAEFISDLPQYYQDAKGNWWLADYAVTTKYAFEQQTKPSFLAKLFKKNYAIATDFYPNPNVESTSVDGSIYAYTVGSTWASLAASDGSTAVDDGANYFPVYITSNTISGQWTILMRGIYLFDTSSLGSSAVVSSAVLSIYGSGKTDGLSAVPNIDIYTSAPVSNTALAPGDFDSLGSVSQTGSPITYANWSTTGYNNFTFNATGISNISKTGISKFGVRNANYDVANVAPNWVSGQVSYLLAYFAEQTGTSQDPKLAVTYTVGPADEGVWSSCETGVLTCDAPWTYSMGYKFTPTQNGQVTKLCGYFTGTKWVRLYNSSYAVLSSVQVSSSNSWTCTAITPVNVIANSVYYVVTEIAGSGGCYRTSPGLPKTCGIVAINASVYQGPSGTFNISHNEDVNYMFGMADVVFSPAPVNSAPTISSVADAPYPVTVGSPVTFTANWTDPNAGDQTKLHICKTNAISGQTCTGGSWCDTASFSATSPSSCAYTAQTGDVATSPNNYYAFVCDDDNVCSASIAGTWTAQAVPVGEGILGVCNLGTPVCGAGGSYSMGYKFTPTQNGQVTKLCGYFSGTKWVRLYNSSYTTLSSVQITSSNNWACTSITPINVTAGSVYYVVAEIPDSFCYITPSPTPPTTCGTVTINTGVYQAPSGTFNVSHSESAAQMYGMADVVFSPAPVNSAPTISSVADAPYPVTVGSPVTFTANWTDPNAGDQTKLHICKTNAISGQTCTGGSWCDTTTWNATSPSSCSYVADTGDVGSHSYYAFICDDENVCSASSAGVWSATYVGSDQSVLGFAWSENIGWVSFDCNNPELSSPRCVNSNYGVNIDSVGNFSGFAWSENIGWIQFDPTGPYPGLPNYSAKLDNNSGVVTGWARALSNGGGWDGWIRLDGVNIDKISGNFSGFAWGSEVVGWLNFSGANYQTRTTLNLNTAPTVGGLSVEQGDYCSYPLHPILSWNFSDADSGDYQSGYNVQIDDDSNVADNPLTDSCVPASGTCSSGHGASSYAPLTSFAYNSTYYWRVKVADNHLAWSTWSGNNSFTTPAHAFPNPDFNATPVKINKGEVAQFCATAQTGVCSQDVSLCYDGAGQTISCSGKTFLWSFPSGTQFGTSTSPASENPIVNFVSSGPKSVSLTITDEVGFCSIAKVINVTQALPKWQETPP